jgi:WG containing repeat
MQLLMLSRFLTKICLLTIVCLPIVWIGSQNLANTSASKVFNRELDPYEELGMSESATIATEPIARINVREHDVYFDRRRGRLLKPPGYFQELYKFSEGLARVVKHDRVGFINERGEWAIPPQFQNKYSSPDRYELSFHEGAAAITVGDNYGFINRQGKLFTSTNFKHVRAFDRGLAVVQVGDKYGLINKQGKFVLKPQFAVEPEGSFTRGGMLVKRNGKERCIDNRGLPAADRSCAYIRAIQVAPDVFEVKNGKVYHRGKLLADRQWDEVVGSSQAYRGAYMYRAGKKWGLVHESGTIITPPQFDDINIVHPLSRVFRNGLAKVKVNGKYGFVDETGKFIIPATLIYVDDFGFDPQITPAQSGGKWGYINRQGKFIIPPRFTEAQNFDRRFGALAMVKIANKYGFIDRQGKIVVPAQFDEIYDNTPYNGGVGVLNYFDSLHNDGLVPARIGTKWGYINTHGIVQIPIRFDRANSFLYGVAEVQAGNRILYLDRQGKVLSF